MDGVGSDQHMKREREKARALRQSRWWQNLIAREPPCYYCEVQLSKSQVTMDHIVPLGQGGLSTPGNIVPACKACNTLKRDMTAVEWTLHLEERRANKGASGG